MDLQRYFHVLSRFRLLVAVGLVFACVLSFFSYFRIGSSGITHRQSETWQGTAVLFVTQKGFPYGYSVLPSTSQTAPAKTGASSQFGNPSWFASLAAYYAPLVQGDAFVAMLRQRTHIKGLGQKNSGVSLSAQPVVNNQGLPQPYIDLYGDAPSESEAVSLANKAAGALKQYIVDLQVANKIPSSKRVELQLVTNATAHNATIVAPRKKTTPIVVFLTILVATVGLAFVLENFRPRIRLVPSDEEEQQPIAARRVV